MVGQDEVISFLENFKESVSTGRATIARRKDPKINDLLYELGWTREVLFKYLVANLEFSDYDSGPQDDHNGSEGDIWVFGKTIENIEVYIKIKIQSNGVKCLSFHKSSRRFTYPLKGSDNDE